jgi:hypothetical protein
MGKPARVSARASHRRNLDAMSIDATEWLMDQQDAGYLIHRDSYITAAQVAELRQRLG